MLITDMILVWIILAYIHKPISVMGCIGTSAETDTLMWRRSTIVLYLQFYCDTHLHLNSITFAKRSVINL